MGDMGDWVNVLPEFVNWVCVVGEVEIWDGGGIGVDVNAARCIPPMPTTRPRHVTRH